MQCFADDVHVAHCEAFKVFVPTASHGCGIMMGRLVDRNPDFRLTGPTVLARGITSATFLATSDLVPAAWRPGRGVCAEEPRVQGLGLQLPVEPREPPTRSYFPT